MRLRCPSCGAVGTDREPSPLREQTRDEQAYAFEVYGNLDRRPVRKCLRCGAGIRVTFLPPRFRKLSDEEWAEFKVRFETWRAAQIAERERRDPETDELTEYVRQAVAGQRQVYPAWALRQFVKFTIILRFAPERVAELAAAGKADSSPEKAAFEAQLDAVLGDYGRALATRVLARVTFSREQLQGMTTEEQQDENAENSMSRDAKPTGHAKAVVADRGPTRPSDAEFSGEELLRRWLDERGRPAMPAGTLCDCCGSADIDPTDGWIGGGWFLCRDCRGLLINADFEVDGRMVGETMLDCPVHGCKTLGSS
jgi:hypothetical protein